MNPLISVIIPAYNVAPYIRKSVESVINQTYKNLQIILIDDGATDETGKICDELAFEDSRIEVIHQKNKGLAGARNTGLDIAKGEWVAFLDSDDWIELEMYEVLLNLAIEYDADISSCKTRNVGPDIPVKGNDNNGIEIIQFDSDEIIIDLLSQKHVRFEVWNKLFRKSLIGNTRFVVGQIREDVHWDRIIFTESKRFVYTTQVLHNYYSTRPGNINSSFKVAGMCVYDEFRKWMKVLEESNRGKLTEVIACMAINKFAIADYILAMRTNQNEEIKNNLKKEFVYFYQIAKNSPYRSKMAISIFRISPRLYKIILDTKIFDLYLKIYHRIKK